MFAHTLNHMSKNKNDTDRETRTHNPRIRSPMRYPIAPGRLGHTVLSIDIAFKTFGQT